MRYLITGGLGFVGSWVTRHLALAGHEVIVLSRGTANPPLRANVPAPYTLCTLDLTAPRAALAAALTPLVAGGLDGCVHLAAAADEGSANYGREALAATVAGTRNLLEALTDAAGAAKAAPPPLIYGSTFHVYGRAEGVVDESTPPAPKSEYALTHLLAEEYCRLFTRAHGLPTLCLRLTNGYGAPLTLPFGKWKLLLPDLCRMAFSQKSLCLRSNPATRRDFVWLGDVAAVCEQLLDLLGKEPQRPDLAGQTLNLASGVVLSIDDIVMRVVRVYEQLYGEKLPVVREAPYSPLPELTVQAENVHGVLETFTFSDCVENEIADTFRILEQAR